MRFYTCFGIGGNDHHACAKAYRAVTAAGYAPELKKVYGSGFLPGFLQTKGRRVIKQKTGTYFTPAIELDDGTVIGGSDAIVAWAAAHPSKDQ